MNKLFNTTLSKIFTLVIIMFIIAVVGSSCLSSDSYTTDTITGKVIAMQDPNNGRGGAYSYAILEDGESLPLKSGTHLILGATYQFQVQTQHGGLFDGNRIVTSYSLVSN